MNPLCDVLIIGAGPTGLLLAHLLRKQGISFRIVESNAKPGQESRALGIQARTLELMRNLGLVDEFLKSGIVSPGTFAFLKGKKRAELNFNEMPFPDTPYRFLFFAPQTETERILLEALKKQNVEVERQTTLLGFKQNETHVEAQVQKEGYSPEIIKAKYIVGCDGSHSRVRKQLGLEFKGDAYTAEFIMADAEVEWDLPYDRVCVFFETGTIGVFFPLKDKKLSRVLTTRLYTPKENAPDTSETTSFPATLEEVEENMRKATHQNLKLKNPQWVTKYHVHHRSVDQVKVGRAFLAGDASHIHSPVGAQGMNTGLQDVANLAWKLNLVLKGQAPESILETYHSERWPIGQKLLNFTDRLFILAISRNFFFVNFRNFIFPIATRVLMNFENGRKMMFRFISQLGIRYHESEVAKQNSSSKDSSLPAGKRAPNATVKPGSELFDLLIGYRFHLLIVSRKPLSKPECDGLRTVWKKEANFPKLSFEEHWLVDGNTNEEVFERYGIKDQAVFVIRPDGYIGYRSDRFENAFSDDVAAGSPA